MNTLNQMRHKHSGNCITVKLTRITQEVETNLADERSVLAFLSTDLGHMLAKKFNDVTKKRTPESKSY